MDVGTSFIDFLLQHDMAEVAKNIEKIIVFVDVFDILVVKFLG